MKHDHPGKVLRPGTNVCRGDTLPHDCVPSLLQGLLVIQQSGRDAAWPAASAGRVQGGRGLAGNEQRQMTLQMLCKRHVLLQVVEIENRFAKPTALGWRDITALVDTLVHSTVLRSLRCGC
eukprot:568746-Amphidinium_carterae.2